MTDKNVSGVSFEEVNDTVKYEAAKKFQGSLLSSKNIEELHAFEDENGGRFGDMLFYLTDFIKKGIDSGRFTLNEAAEDLGIALWYAYACCNMDSYEHYFLASGWMPSSEKNASGCGVWFYRYSNCLMYCGKLEEARKYAEQGLIEEPDYPWGWFHAAKLRSHFGDKEGALAAVDRGLSLVPGDYEFLTLRREIEEGRTLAEMEYHYIDPKFDRDLQEGLCPDSMEKIGAISGILCDKEKLEEIKSIFRAEDGSAEWVADSPYCSSSFVADDYPMEYLFCMNEAALSKMDTGWLRMQRDKLQTADYLFRKPLNSVWQMRMVSIIRDYGMDLLYENKDTELALVVPLRRDQLDSDQDELAFIDFALREAELRGTSESQPLEFQLYRTENGVLHHAECWFDGDTIVEYSGIVGEEGELKMHECKSDEEASSFFEMLYEWYASQGYCGRNEADRASVVVQISPVCSKVGMEYIGPAEFFQLVMDELLRSRGFGYVAACEPERGEYAHNPGELRLKIFCAVVKAEQAVEIIKKELEENYEYTGLTISVAEHDGDRYRIVYSAQGIDRLL